LKEKEGRRSGREKLWEAEEKGAEEEKRKTKADGVRRRDGADLPSRGTCE
jgi:hypothetical protein